MTEHKPKQHSAKPNYITQFMEKIVVNCGVGRLGQNPNFAEKGLAQVSRDLGLITGQKVQPRPSKISIAGFKMREGQIVGLRATLRHKKMIDFFTRLTTIVLPRVHDFRGIAEGAIDEGGVLNIGLKDHVVFPEINPEESPIIFSFQISVVPKVRDRKAAATWYHANGIPFKKIK